MILSRIFATHVRLTGLKDAISLAGFPALSRGMMVAMRKTLGTSASRND